MEFAEQVGHGLFYMIEREREHTHPLSHTQLILCYIVFQTHISYQAYCFSLIERGGGRREIICSMFIYICMRA